MTVVAAQAVAAAVVQIEQEELEKVKRVQEIEVNGIRIMLNKEHVSHNEWVTGKGIERLGTEHLLPSIRENLDTKVQSRSDKSIFYYG